MKTLYEASHVGFNYGHPVSYTGIYRVITGFFAELARTRPIEPAFTATQAFPAHVGLRSYIAETGLFPAASLRSVWRKRRTPAGLATTLVQQLPRSRPAPRDPVYRRRLRLCLNAVRRSVVRVRLDEPFDVFHSLFYALPEVDTAPARVRVLTVYDLIPVLFPHYFPRTFDAAGFRHMLRSAHGPNDYVITISENTRRDFCDFTGTDPQRVFVAEPAASPQVFHREEDPQRLRTVRTRYGIPPGAYALALFTLEPRKNVALLIDAFLDVVRQERLTDVRLVLVGSKGWGADHLDGDSGRRAALRDTVVFTGRIPDEDLAAVYSGASLFVYPSLYEGFGLPVLEAMQCGVPVVTSNTSAMPEVAGEAAALVDPADRAGLSRAMLEILVNPAVQLRMRTVGLAQARRFSWAKHVAATVAAYDAVLSASG